MKYLIETDDLSVIDKVKQIMQEAECPHEAILRMKGCVGINEVDKVIYFNVNNEPTVIYEVAFSV